jgi:hypothetical protein
MLKKKISRFYREWAKDSGLVSYEIAYKDSDLFVSSNGDRENMAISSLRRHRAEVEKYIEDNPDFKESYVPVHVEVDAPAIIGEMADAARIAGVGPMAAVAGAIAEFVGRDLAERSREVIVENGGDIFIKSAKKRLIGIYAGNSPLSGKLAVDLNPTDNYLGVCTSSGTFGHSVSFGKADAAVVVAKRTALADAAATAAGNAVKSERDIETVLRQFKLIGGISGVIIIVGEKIGTIGDISLKKI